MYNRQTVIDLKTGRKFLIEPISEHADRNADWLKGMKNAPKGGAIHPDDSIITEENGFTNIAIVEGSPYSYIEKILNEPLLPEH